MKGRLAEPAWKAYLMAKLLCSDMLLGVNTCGASALCLSNLLRPVDLLHRSFHVGFLQDDVAKRG